MNIHLGLGQGVSQQQQLNLAPQLLQWLRLLQVPAQQLVSMVRHELETNPALEIDDEPVVDSAGEDMPDEGVEDRECLDARTEALGEIDADWAAEERQANCSVSEQERYEYRLSKIRDRVTLRESLLRQIAVMGLSGEQAMRAERIIGSLDRRGYLSVSLETLAAETGDSLEAFEDALSLVQQCEPDGVGARDLQECLMLQLADNDPLHAVARRIVMEYLDALARGQTQAIARRLDVSADIVDAAADIIRACNPRPGCDIEDDDSAPVVTPDVMISFNEYGELEVEVAQRDIPRLRLSRTCRELIKRGNLSREEAAYVRSRIRAAMFLMDGLHKREATLRRIALEIVRGQRRYICGEEDQLRPLTMVKVAGMIGVHDTTVSRALAEKYVATPRGVFSMKHFFQSGYKCDDGSSQTPDMVRRTIQRMILAEDPGKPIKDEVLSRRLRQQGVPVARRTVAKYRAELGLPSSKERAAAIHRANRRTQHAAKPADLSLAVAG